MNIKLGHKAGSGSQRKPVTAPDSASSKSYARIVYGINDGHMVGFMDGLKSLILDNTPVQSSSGEMNITEVEVQTRWGTNDQDYLEGFPSVVNEIGYNNVEIVSDHNFVHYVNDLNTNAVGIRFTWGKIFRQNESNGDIYGYRIDYAVDIQTDGNGFVEVLSTALDDKTSSGYERYHRLELPPAEVGWEIRVRRLTANTASDFIGDKMYLSAVAEIVDAKLRYPNTALIALKFDADKFGSIPKADFRLRGKIIKVPTNYNPETRTYAVTGEGTTNGIWDGSFKLAYTNNPVWIFYDLLLSKRYGLGERLDASMVDKWALYSIGQYCDVMVPDGLGGTEPRLTCNVYINSKYEAFDLLMQLASTFRGILHWDGASIVATADRPSDPVFTFTRANIIGEFNYSGTRARDRSSMISVAFDDPANNYKTDKEVVSDTSAIAEVGVRLKELTAFGCTSRGQAQRIGRLGLLKEQQELRMVTFTVGLDGYIPVTGKIIEIADPLLAGRAIGGRISVVSSDGLVITLDREVTANAGDVLVANGDDGIQQRRDITKVNGNVVTVSAAFTGVSAENVWAIDSEDLSLMRFRVLSVAQNRSDDGLITFTISGVQHNPSIDEGADFSAYIEQPTYSNIEIYTQVAPTELVIGSENVINQGLDITNVVFSWPQAVNAVKYELEWRRDNGSWIKAPIIYSNTFVVENVYHGLYEARIVAINSMDVRSLYTLAQPTIINSKFAEPPMLSFIQATGIQFGAEISWVFPARESQNAEYVEVQISYREDKTDAKLLGNYAYPLNRAEINGLHANLKLWVKARIIDRNKVEGPWTVWVTTTTDAEASILLDALSGMITSSQLDQDLTTAIATGVAAEATAATANTTASNAQIIANTAKSAADQAKAEVAALTTSTNTTATELRDRLTTAENGLTQEKLDRASGDDAVVGQLNTYKSSNDAALAAVQQKAEAATTASTSNAQAITNLTATVNTKNRTYRQTTAPTAGLILGDLWINTTAGKNNEVRRWNGTAWDDLTDPRPAANATAISNMYTKTEVDAKAASAASGAVSAFTATLNGKGTNLADYSTSVGEVVALSDWLRLNTDVTTEANRGYLPTEKAFKLKATGAETYGFAMFPRISRIDYDTSAQYILSAYVKSPVARTIRYRIAFFDINPVDGRYQYTYGAIISVNLVADTWTRISAAATNTAGRGYMTLSIDTNSSGAAVADDNYFLVSRVMHERTYNLTNKPSEWVAGTVGVSTKIDATAAATDVVATRVTQVEGSISSQSTRVTSLENSVNHATTGLATKASSAALSTLDSKVTGIDGRVTSNSSSITSLNNSLTTTNTNVATAQTAAQNAMTAAGQKGKVIFGTTAPVAADQLSQNLWIDTTGNANTPKRWNGTAWVVVTDKVATDALAAANAASSLAATKADSSALTALDSKVTTVDGKVTTNASNISTLQGKVTTVENGLATKAEGSALTALTTRVTNAEGVNTSQGSAITTLQNTVNHATTGLATKASSAALSTLDSKVTGIDGRVTANTTQVTQLNSSLTTTNDNVTAAQNAADAAASLAGSKGKVLVQTAAPTVADRLEQNLWIDITNNANTPKRWNGSTWVAVTDKIATDAASAAASALSVAQTKADASIVSSLSTKVDTIDGKVTSQASSLSTLSTTVGNNTAAIQLQQSSIDGINAKATLQVEAGGTIGGVALGNNGGVVDFLIRSNTFAVAPPVGYSGSNKYLMTYRATPITLPNGTVVSEGLYLNNLIVDYIDASKIYAESLSAVSANVGTFTTTNEKGTMKISGTEISVKDINGVERIYIGL